MITSDNIGLSILLVVFTFFLALRFRIVKEQEHFAVITLVKFMVLKGPGIVFKLSLKVTCIPEHLYACLALKLLK